MRPVYPIQQDERWKEHARCLGRDTSIFFPGRSPSAGQVQRIINFCTPCKVKRECLEYALAHNEEAGWWGGMSEGERRRIRRQRRYR